MSKWRTFGFLVAYAAQLATAQNHFETYTQLIYRTKTTADTYSRQTCSGWWWGHECVTRYYLQYRIAAEAVFETYRRCQRGWSPPTMCNVLNRCEEGTSGCQQRCDYGGAHATYVCSCRYGYELETDGHTCKHMDECTKRGNDCRKIGNSICQLTSVGYQCVCEDGFTLVAPQRCSDLDECVTGTDNCKVSENFVCQNTIGGYECVCRQGFLLGDSQRCSDLDECVTGTDNCKASENFVCQNTIGGYECVCRQGFLLDDSQRCIVKERDESNVTPRLRTEALRETTVESPSTADSSVENSPGWLATDNDVSLIGIYAAIGIGGVIVTAAVIVTICVCYRRKKRKGIIERVVTAEVLYENSTEMCGSSSNENDYVDADTCVYQELRGAMNGPDQNVYEALRNAGKRRRKPSSDNKTSKM